MSDEKRLIGEVKRDGTLLYELTTVDGPHGQKVESKRWEASVGSVMRACSMDEREQIAERLRVAANAFEPMRALLVRCATAARDVAALARAAKVLAVAGGHSASERVYRDAEVEFEELAADLRTCLRAADGATEGT